MVVGFSDFMEGLMEKWGQTGKMLNFSELLTRIFTVCPWMEEHPHFIILTPNALFDSRIEPEN